MNHVIKITAKCKNTNNGKVSISTIFCEMCVNPRKLVEHFDGQCGYEYKFMSAKRVLFDEVPYFGFLFNSIAGGSLKCDIKI